jgi:hypothetical protein
VPPLYVQLVQKKLRQALTGVLVLLLKKNTNFAEKVYKNGEWIQLIKDGNCLCALIKTEMKFLTRLLTIVFSMRTLLQGRKVCDKCD